MPVLLPPLPTSHFPLSTSHFPLPTPSITLSEQTIIIQENQTGISYDLLFGSYLHSALAIKIMTPHLANLSEINNLIEFIETIIKYKIEGEDIELHLITNEDESQIESQLELLNNIAQSCLTVGINFTWEFAKDKKLTGCQIITDHGWEISLNGDFNLFQPQEQNNLFSFTKRLQHLRLCKPCEIKYTQSYQNSELIGQKK
jgi:ATP-dependent Lon protease